MSIEIVKESNEDLSRGVRSLRAHYMLGGIEKEILDKFSARMQELRFHSEVERDTNDDRLVKELLENTINDLFGHGVENISSEDLEAFLEVIPS